MNYFLNEQQEMIRDLSRKVAVEKIRPVAAKHDEEQTFPWDVVRELAAADLFAIFIPEQYGGLGGGVLELCIAVEELSRACGGIALALAASALGSFPLILFGSEEQKRKYLPDLAAGKKLAAFALTEPNAGSDAASIQTTAVKDGDSYVLNGTKQWITNAGEAEIYTVVAMTDRSKGARGATTFILEKGMPGFEFGKKENKLGIRASATREIILRDCRVPKGNVLGAEGLGFIVAMKTFDQSRPGVAAQAVGIAQGALDEAMAYARERVQFGKPIASFQGLQFMLADMATEIEAARALVYQTARTIDAGEKNIAKESAMCKVFASDVAMKVTINAVQVFGGYGYMKEYPVEKMMRDAKITQIYEGTNEIQRGVIASNLIKEYARKKK
ncbi:MAG: acyl-CoA dehydrogenase family protein [bacterium]|nr:acyl-CoA dehydrogenase family protein [bacterium]